MGWLGTKGTKRLRHARGRQDPVLRARALEKGTVDGGAIDAGALSKC